MSHCRCHCHNVTATVIVTDARSLSHCHCHCHNVTDTLWLPLSHRCHCRNVNATLSLSLTQYRCHTVTVTVTLSTRCHCHDGTVTVTVSFSLSNCHCQCHNCSCLARTNTRLVGTWTAVCRLAPSLFVEAYISPYRTQQLWTDNTNSAVAEKSRDIPVIWKCPCIKTEVNQTSRHKLRIFFMQQTYVNHLSVRLRL